jgi:HTH-type transcriptional regulator/antitoxin HigA
MIDGESIGVGGEAKPPGEFLRDELERRGWTQDDLAKIITRPLSTVNGIIQGKHSITPEMAIALGAALGTPPEVWMNRESTFRLSLVSSPGEDIERRARLYSIAPVKDMQKRQWIRRTDSPESLEQELCRFFNIPSIDQTPTLNVNASQSFKTASLNPSQIAWCFRSAKLASIIDAESFKPRDFASALSDIRKLADYPEKAKHLPRILAKAGVRLVVVEPLLHSRIDGAAFWLADDAPVVVLSIRYDRIDCLWFTLFHELMHIKHSDAQSVDMDLIGDENREGVQSNFQERRERILREVEQLQEDIDFYNQIETRANQEATNLLIPSAEMRSFILRMKPFYSKARIVQFAIRMQIHPGIVVGQLHQAGEIGWSTNREMLAKVRDIATSTAVTDGWGKSAPVL